jgi:hypothetical protein
VEIVSLVAGIKSLMTSVPATPNDFNVFASHLLFKADAVFRISFRFCPAMIFSPFFIFPIKMY